MFKWLSANLTTSQPYSDSATCHCLPSCIFTLLFLPGWLSLPCLTANLPTCLFIFLQSIPASVLPSLHLPMCRPWIQLPQHSTYTQHTVDTTNLTIISAQIISSCLPGWWIGRQRRGREEGREIRVMGSITSPVHTETSYETTAGWQSFYRYLTMIKTSSDWLFVLRQTDNFRKSGTACIRESITESLYLTAALNEQSLSRAVASTTILDNKHCWKVV